MKTIFEDRVFKGKDEEFKGWRIWEKPKATHQYAIGVDVAEGKGQDASVIQVINCINNKVVANYWSNQIDEDNFAAEIYKAGYFYNRAKVIIECNNTGSAVISCLSGVMGGLRYPMLYKRLEYDEYTQKRTKMVGFKTTTTTKPRIISNLKAALRDGELVTFDKYTIQELSTFVRDEKTGKIGSKGSSRDDRVMALALAWEQARLVKMSLDTREETTQNLTYDPVTGFPM